MQSKKDKLLELFFNSPKYWHFKELLEKSSISRPQLARWLKILEKEKLIKRIKHKARMPYYIQNTDGVVFENRKKLFTKEKLVNSGFLDHLSTLKNAKVVILFGSFSRSDWWRDSDIDIFIYGNDDGLERGKYELKLKREIQVHKVKNQKDLKRIEKMLPYIIAGDFIKGSVEELGVEVHAKN